jgi:hypothetical protein
MTKPRWCLGMLGTPRRQFGNIVGHVKGVENMGSLSEWTAKQFDPRLSWADVEWIKQRWGGKLILKGIQDVEDARLAVDSGADALIVSNHGGRQLDGAPSSISALPEIVEAVGNRIEVHMDGGIRSGQHVLKAVALGAKGTYIGRAMLYGLGAMGQEGVEKALQIIRNELDLSMAFCGRTDISQVDKSILLPGTYPSGRAAGYCLPAGDLAREVRSGRAPRAADGPPHSMPATVAARIHSPAALHRLGGAGVRDRAVAFPGLDLPGRRHHRRRRAARRPGPRHASAPVGPRRRSRGSPSLA